MHLDLQEEDEVFAILPEHPHGSLCVCLCVCAHECVAGVCVLIVQGHPQQPKNPERGKHISNQSYNQNSMC